MVFAATARWNFRGETRFSVEIEAVDIEAAGAAFYAMLPITFLRGNRRLLAIKARECGPGHSKISDNPCDAAAAHRDMVMASVHSIDAA
jgi:hypothetical protein